eukprot:gene6683-10848_t
MCLKNKKKVAPTISKTDETKHYCPICMLYNQCNIRILIKLPDIFQTECCSNNICLQCWLQMKKYQRDLFCPFCITTPFFIVSISQNEKSKNYDDEIEPQPKENTKLQTRKFGDENIIPTQYQRPNRCCWCTIM